MPDSVPPATQSIRNYVGDSRKRMHVIHPEIYATAFRTSFAMPVQLDRPNES